MTAFAGDMLRDSELGDPAPAITLTLSNLPRITPSTSVFSLPSLTLGMASPLIPVAQTISMCNWDGSTILHETFANDGRGQSYGGWGQLAYNADLGFNRGPRYV